MMLLICCFASVSAAQAAPADGGVDIRAAIDVPITLQVHSERRDGSDETTHPKYLMSGLNGTIPWDIAGCMAVYISIRNSCIWCLRLFPWEETMVSLAEPI